MLMFAVGEIAGKVVNQGGGGGGGQSREENIVKSFQVSEVRKVVME